MLNKTILVFKHMPSQNPGVFRRLALKRGIRFHEIDLHGGDTIPTVTDYDGLWVMGGSMQAWDEKEFPWLIEEKSVIREVVNTHKMPFLGVCLGHQLLADALGGEIGLSDAAELGVIHIEKTAAGQSHPLLTNLPMSPGWTCVHTAEVKQPPSGAVVLARSNKCKNHIMQVNAVTYSCQFHPEVCDHTLPDWLKIPGITPYLQETLGDAGFDRFSESITSNMVELNEAAKQFFDNWLEVVYQ